MCLLRKERTGFVEPARKRIGRLRYEGLDGWGVTLSWTYPPAAAPSRLRKVFVKLDQGCSKNL